MAKNTRYIYIYVFKRYGACHLRQITALAVSCIAITPGEKTCPMFFETRARAPRD